MKSVPRLPATLSSMASSKALKTFKHLSDIILPDERCTNVDILIGSNVSDCLIIRNQRNGAPGEPYVQRFKLVWAVIGLLNNHSTKFEVSLVNLISDVSDTIMIQDKLTALKSLPGPSLP